MRLFFICGAMACLLLASCRTGFDGELMENLPPETFTIVDTIIRPGDDRLESEVTIRWWGNDPDGFITGYEFTFNSPEDPGTEWAYSANQDSVFILAPPPGNDTLDFRFYVRAIDNNDARDPSPAALTYPVKNYRPSVVFVPGINNPTISYPVVKFFWEGSDPDGVNNLAGYEVTWNDSMATPLYLNASISNLMLEAIDPGSATTACRLYLNSSLTPVTDELDGMLTDAWNKLYIRAVDQSDARSEWVAADSVFIKSVNSNILLVNGYTTGTTPEAFYTEQLAANGFTSVETLKIFESVDGNFTQQSADNLTQEKVFALFDLIVWFSNGAENSLSLAQRTTETFFANGGKLLMSVYVSSSFDPLSNFLEFTPVASLVSPSDTTLILETGAQLLPEDAGYPELESTSIVGIVKPVQLQIGASAIYTAQLTAKDNATLTFTPWEGESTVIARKTAGGETTFVLSTLELQKLNGLMNMDAFFEQIIIDEFGF